MKISGYQFLLGVFIVSGLVGAGYKLFHIPKPENCTGTSSSGKDIRVPKAYILPNESDSRASEELVPGRLLVYSLADENKLYNVNFNNLSLELVCDSISKLGDFYVHYDPGILNENYTITIHAKEKTLFFVLKQIIKQNNKISFIVANKTVCIKQTPKRIKSGEFVY